MPDIGTLFLISKDLKEKKHFEAGVPQRVVGSALPVLGLNFHF